MANTLQIKDRRDPFISQRLKLATFSALVYIFLYLLLWKSMPVWRAAHPIFNAKELNHFLDLILFIGAVGYVFIFFSLSFLWSRKKFTLILHRVDGICRAIAKTGKPVELRFRKGDRFKFFESTFNNLISESVEQNERRLTALRHIERELRMLDGKMNVEDADRLLADLEGPPWKMRDLLSDSSV